MARDTTPNYEPHLVPCDAQGHRCERSVAILWAVVMKTGPGQFDWLSDPLPRRMAAREMRRIRAEMARLWWEKRQSERTASSAITPT
jgi:hypothetical protein